MSLTFPKDMTIYEDSLQWGRKKVNFDEIKSIGLRVTGETTNLTAWTGIPTLKGVGSWIEIVLENMEDYTSKNETINIKVSNYEEWFGFKNKEGVENLQHGVSFVEFLEEKTFEQRVNHYLKTGTHDMHFKYQGLGYTEIYEFLKNKTIILRGKRFASFLDDEYEIKQSYRQLYFKEKKFNAVNFILGQDERDKKIINLIYDEDVILHLIEKLIGVSPKNE